MTDDNRGDAAPRQDSIDRATDRGIDAYAMGESLRLVASGINDRWIQSDTVVEVRQ